MSIETPDRSDDAFGPEVLLKSLQAAIPDGLTRSWVIALSGGGDSGALLAAAALLASHNRSLRLRALHVNHALQSAAAEFEAAARVQAQTWQLPLQVLHVQVGDASGQGVEAAAREARYRALAEAIAPQEVVLTAHHRDDQAETVLLQLLRGAGVDGVCAMPLCVGLGRGLHVRPCLGVTRAALQSFAQGLGLAFVDDPMNGDLRFERAYLRQVLNLPLEARWPRWTRTLARSAGHFAQAKEVLDEVASADWAAARRGSALTVSGLATLSAARQALLLRHWLKQLGFRVPNARRLTSLRAMLPLGPSASPEVRWPGVVVFRHDGCLWAASPWSPWPQSPVVIQPGQSVTIPDLGCVALKMADSPAQAGQISSGVSGLTLKRREGGERLQLTRAGQRRAVKDLLREARVPGPMRDCLPFLWLDGRCVGVLLPQGLWLDISVRADVHEAGWTLNWHDLPVSLYTTFIEAVNALP